MQKASETQSHWSGLVGQIADLLDLDQTARDAGALVRKRAIRTGEMLLRLILAYGPGGLSLRAAAAWAGINGLADLSDTAVMNRIRKSAGWLGEIAGVLLRRRAPAARSGGGILAGRQLRILDGSVITAPGSQGTDWRLHATYDPAGGRFTDLELTDCHGSEGFARATLRPGDVALADRNYAKPAALAAVLAQGADFIVRVGWSSLRLLGQDGAPLAWAPLFETMAPGETREQVVAVEQSGVGGKLRGKPLFQARLIIWRADAAAAERGARRVRRSHSKRRARTALQPITVTAAGFVMILTSLPDSIAATEVLDAYRLRWQVELAFKRLKSLLGLDRLPAKSPDLARSWLLAHLILALLIDDSLQELLDSPPSAERHASARRLGVAADAVAA